LDDGTMKFVSFGSSQLYKMILSLYCCDRQSFMILEVIRLPMRISRCRSSIHAIMKAFRSWWWTPMAQ